MDASRFDIRRATADDAEALASLSDQLGYPSSAEQVRRRIAEMLSQPGHVVFVAATRPTDTPGGLAGWVHGFVHRTVESDPTVEIGGFVVDEKQRGSGIGRLLMAQLERWAQAAGCAAITVRSNVIRDGAHAFYQRLGFGVVKTQRVFRKELAR